MSRGWLRWWDGQGWTAHQAPAQMYGVVAPDPTSDLATEDKWARWGRIAFVAVAVCTVALYFYGAWLGHWIRHQCHDQLAAGALSCNVSSQTDSLRIQAAFLVVALPALLLALWLFQVAKVARRLGLPARREPGWAFAFFVPIVNIWFPYQVARDALPPGHARRSVVGWWWAMYLVQGFVVLPVMLAGGLGSFGAGVVVAIVGAVLPALAAWLGIRMLGEIHCTHRELLTQLRQSAPKYG